MRLWLPAVRRLSEGSTVVAMDEQLFLEHFEPSGEAVSTSANYSANRRTLCLTGESGSPVNTLLLTSCAGVQLVEGRLQFRLPEPLSRVTRNSGPL